MLIITSKTKTKIARSFQAENVSKYGKPHYSGAAREQYRKVSRANREEFRNDKRILELHKKGFNEAAITGMMHTGKEGGMEGHVKEVIRKFKGKIHTDGNV